MAKLKIKKGEKRFQVTMSQEEFDFLSGLIDDLGDSPARQVTMNYRFEDSEVVPTKRGKKILKSLGKGFENSADTMGEGYDYFDYWKDYK